MNIKGPIKITIEGPQGSGKSQISEAILDMLAEEGINVVGFSEGAEVEDLGQTVSIIEQQHASQ